MSVTPLEEDIKFTSVCESGSSDPQVLHEPQILHLMPDQHFIELACEWEQTRFTKPYTRNLHSRSGPSARPPGCLDSLDFRQRMYQASLATRISVSFSRLLLNWVATYRHNRMVTTAQPQLLPCQVHMAWRWQSQTGTDRDSQWQRSISMVIVLF